jgi:hypothetical protein
MHRVLYDARDRYSQLRARLPEPSPVAASLSQRNAALLSTQVRVSGGATFAKGQIGEDGRLVHDRLNAVVSRACRRAVR